MKNLERYTYLLDRDAAIPQAVFHYKVRAPQLIEMFVNNANHLVIPLDLQDVENRSGFAHNSIVLSAIKDEWFAEPTGPGIKYMSEFSPIREATLALVITTVRVLSACLTYRYLS